ncbi:MAG TPA: polysaccharide biosynthesis/export family protein, partial [Verrucomicrobiae bacterium]
IFGKTAWARWFCLGGLAALAIGLSGCATPDYSEQMEGPNGSDPNSMAAARLNAGDTITLNLAGLPTPLDPQEKTINEDGTITLDQVGSIKAAGKTTGELEKIIHDLYVPKIYTHLNVTVKAGDRVFYVRGAVGNPNRQIYVGQMTVTKAIASAADFNDFADRKHVLLIRANGKRFTINCNKILKGEAPDPPVFPGDQIVVPRSSI